MLIAGPKCLKISTDEGRWCNRSIMIKICCHGANSELNLRILNHFYAQFEVPNTNWNSTIDGIIQQLSGCVVLCQISLHAWYSFKKVAPPTDSYRAIVFMSLNAVLFQVVTFASPKRASIRADCEFFNSHLNVVSAENRATNQLECLPTDLRMTGCTTAACAGKRIQNALLITKFTWRHSRETNASRGLLVNYKGSEYRSKDDDSCEQLLRQIRRFTGECEC